jgi:predicted Rossmann-fold nucleotide-binding protein
MDHPHEIDRCLLRRLEWRRSRYADAARELARVLVEHNIGLVYGGGKVGLMGVIADEVLRLGGEATGVIPRRWSSAKSATPA